MKNLEKIINEMLNKKEQRELLSSKHLSEINIHLSNHIEKTKDEVTRFLDIDDIEEYSPLSAFFIKKELIKMISDEIFDENLKKDVTALGKKITPRSGLYRVAKESGIKEAYSYFSTSTPGLPTEEITADEKIDDIYFISKLGDKRCYVKIPLFHGIAIKKEV